MRPNHYFLNHKNLIKAKAVGSFFSFSAPLFLLSFVRFSLSSYTNATNIFICIASKMLVIKVMPYRCHFETIKRAKQNGVAFNYMAYTVVSSLSTLFVVIVFCLCWFFFSAFAFVMSLNERKISLWPSIQRNQEDKRFETQTWSDTFFVCCCCFSMYFFSVSFSIFHQIYGS